MNRTDALVLRNASWEPGYLEDTGPRLVVLDLYDAEHIALRRYLAFLGVDSETGRDLLQEAFLKLHQHLLGDGDRKNLRAWLFRVVHNLARNHQVAHRATKTDLLSDLVRTKDLVAADEPVEEKLLQDERQRRFHKELSNLPPAQRECLLLRSSGLKYREIAQVLEVSTSSVGENIQRGLAQLRKIL